MFSSEAITVIQFANSSVKTVLMEKFLETKSILIDFNYLDLNPNGGWGGLGIHPFVGDWLPFLSGAT